jgi:hypothetical protein
MKAGLEHKIPSKLITYELFLGLEPCYTAFSGNIWERVIQIWPLVFGKPFM